MKKFYVAILGLLITSLGFGQTDIAAYSGESSPQATAVANLTATPLSRGAGIGVNAGGSFNSNGFAESSETDAVTANDYVEWSITANAGFSVEISEIEIDYDRSGSGPDNLVIRTSLDGFVSNIYTDIGFGSSGAQPTIDLSLNPLTSVGGGTITFRLYAWNGASGGTFDIEDDIGTVLAQVNTGIRLVGDVNVATANPTISFDSATSSENETNATFNTTIPVTMSNYAAPVTVSVTVNGASTAESGDYTLNTNALTFNADETLNVSLDINDDIDFEDETIVLDIAVTSGTADLGTSQHTVTIIDDEMPPLPNLVINEILADPDGATGDANGDGSVNTSEDEFIEVYNASSSEINLSGYTIEDGFGLRHTFPNNTYLPAGAVIVVFGGGQPTGLPCLTQTASTGSLGLNNGGDTVTVSDDSNVTIVSESYGGIGGNNQSLGKNPDLSGGLVQHTSIATNPVDFSPGRQNADNIPFSKTWTGTTDNDWTLASNWDSNSAPTNSDDNVWIPINATTSPAISSSTTVNSITVNEGSALLINSTATLTVGTLSLNSISSDFSSLILDGAIAGTATVRYSRFVNIAGSGPSGDNDLISPPLNGETWSSFLSSGGNATVLLDDGGTSPTIYAFAPFDKSLSPEADYSNFDSNTLTTLVNGIGYRVATDDGDNLIFTGTAQNGTISRTIENSGVGFEEWNLIGNPYPSYISAFDFLNHNINNTMVLDPLAGAIYGYNGQNTNRWEIINMSSVMMPNSDVLIAPGQGFFVASGVPSGSIEFTTQGSPTAPDMRRTNGGDDFISGRPNDTSNNYNLELLLTSAGQSFKTDFYFNNMSSLGLDIGYDSKIFGSDAPSFSIYSHLVNDNTGVAMGIQSLSENDLEDITIALGVHANQGEQISFSISENTLPIGTEVYLEDNVANTFTLLNQGAYVLTPSTALNGTGRFFLRMRNNALSNPDINTESLRIFTDIRDRGIKISGELFEDTTAFVFDLQGRLVKQVELNSALRLQSIETSGLTSGVYVVQLSNSTQTKTEKVILN